MAFLSKLFGKKDKNKEEIIEEIEEIDEDIDDIDEDIDEDFDEDFEDVEDFEEIEEAEEIEENEEEEYIGYISNERKISFKDQVIEYALSLLNLIIYYSVNCHCGYSKHCVFNYFNCGVFA